MTTPVIAATSTMRTRQVAAFVASSRGCDLSVLLRSIVTSVREASMSHRRSRAELTPNQAAEFRYEPSHLLKLLDKGLVPFHRVGRDRPASAP